MRGTGGSVIPASRPRAQLAGDAYWSHAGAARQAGTLDVDPCVAPRQTLVGVNTRGLWWRLATLGIPGLREEEEQGGWVPSPGLSGRGPCPRAAVCPACQDAGRGSTASGGRCWPGGRLFCTVALPCPPASGSANWPLDMPPVPHVWATEVILRFRAATSKEQ